MLVRIVLQQFLATPDASSVFHPVVLSPAGALNTQGGSGLQVFSDSIAGSRLDVYPLETPMRTMTNFRALSVTASVLMLSALAACVAPMQTSDSAYPAPYPATAPAGAYPQGGYPAAGYPAQNPQRAYTEYGRVSNVEVLRTPEQGRGSGIGAVIGGVAGAVVGRQIGGGSGRDAATVVGAVGGAVAGNAIEKNRNTTVRESYRVSIQLDNGSSRAYDVPSYGELRVGDRVRIENGQIFRM